MTAKQNVSSAIAHDAPVRSRESAEFWGSDAVAAMLRELDIPYIALNPGASYRGLHDSIVNYLGNRDPQMVLSIHDENAVAIAHGYWKASGEMMAAALHANVGLMHATDGDLQRVVRPRADAHHRRDRPVGRHASAGPGSTGYTPASDQGALIRNFTKWDNQPGSPAPRWKRCCAARRSRRPRRAARSTSTSTSRCRRRRSAPLPPLPDVSRYPAPPPAVRPSGSRRQPRRSCSRARRIRSCSPAAARAASKAGSSASRSPRSSTRRVLTESSSRPRSRPITACTSGRRQPLSAERRRCHRRGRRDPVARLARSRRHAQAGVRREADHGEDHPGLVRRAQPSRLEHGLPGAAADRRCT